MEGVFFLYYTQWNLFQVLPAIGVVGVTAFLSGNKALERSSADAWLARGEDDEE